MGINKILLYLCASSRKLDDPISTLILSQSAAGKTYLVETVKMLIPEEDVISITSLSDQALHYIKDLLHKFMIFGEAVHNEKIEHQIREMLSSKELSRMIAVKNDKTGEIASRLVKSKVIVSSVLTSTNSKINPENASRYFFINADESREQTKRIHEAQKAKYTLEKLKAKNEIVPEIIRKHRSAQRLLRKIAIVNNFNQYLNFPDILMRTRRDHERFIDLIAVVCFVRQYQKEVKLDGNIEYIECDLVDYETAYNIMTAGILPATMSELSTSANELYEAIRILVKEEAKHENLKPTEVTLTQREIRENTGYSQSWIKQNLKVLVDFEYIYIVHGGKERTKGFYRLRQDAPISKLNFTMIPTPEKMKKLVLSKAEGIINENEGSKN
jgi:hypothetical protein